MIACWVLTVALTAFPVLAHAEPHRDYILHCQGCHGSDGAGSQDGAPPFTGNLARLASHDEGRAYLLRVPGVQAAELDSERLAAVLNWIAETFDGQQARTLGFRPFQAEEVERWRHQPLASPERERERLQQKISPTQ